MAPCLAMKQILFSVLSFWPNNAILYELKAKGLIWFCLWFWWLKLLKSWNRSGRMQEKSSCLYVPFLRDLTLSHSIHCKACIFIFILHYWLDSQVIRCLVVLGLISYYRSFLRWYIGEIPVRPYCCLNGIDGIYPPRVWCRKMIICTVIHSHKY